MEGIDNSPLKETPKFKVFYDDECEICQASVSWLRLLDRKRQAECIGIHTETLAPHPSLSMDRCLQQLHVVTSDERVLVGWDAVARLARLSRFTWCIGALGAAPPFRWLGHLLYGYVAKNRYAVSKCRGGACHASRPQEVRRAAASHRSGHATAWDSCCDSRLA